MLARQTTCSACLERKPVIVVQTRAALLALQTPARTIRLAGAVEEIRPMLTVSVSQVVMVRTEASHCLHTIPRHSLDAALAFHFMHHMTYVTANTMLCVYCWSIRKRL